MTKKRSHGRTPDRRGGVPLKKPLERTVRQGHPWLFRDALAPFDATPGATVRVLDRDGRFLAVGLAEAGPIGVRVFSLSDEPIDDALFTRRVREAFAARERIID